MGNINGKIHVVRDHITLDKEMIDALKQFIARVYLMRKAQQLYEVIPKGEYLISKLKQEEKVDQTLNILVRKS